MAAVVELVIHCSCGLHLVLSHGIFGCLKLLQTVVAFTYLGWVMLIPLMKG